jgi:hypothetical protein
MPEEIRYSYYHTKQKTLLAGPAFRIKTNECRSRNNNMHVEIKRLLYSLLREHQKQLRVLPRDMQVLRMLITVNADLHTDTFIGSGELIYKLRHARWEPTASPFNPETDTEL